MFDAEDNAYPDPGNPEKDNEWCDCCGHALVLDHVGPDGSRYDRCPHCEEQLEILALDRKERNSDLGIRMRDAAFLWDLGIRVDNDLEQMFRCLRRLEECAPKTWLPG